MVVALEKKNVSSILMAINTVTLCQSQYVREILVDPRPMDITSTSRVSAKPLEEPHCLYEFYNDLLDFIPQLYILKPYPCVVFMMPSRLNRR